MFDAIIFLNAFECNSRLMAMGKGKIMENDEDNSRKDK